MLPILTSTCEDAFIIYYNMIEFVKINHVHRSSLKSHFFRSTEGV